VNQPVLRKGFFPKTYFSDCPTDPEEWFDLFDFKTHVGKGDKERNTRFVWRGYNIQTMNACPQSIKRFHSRLKIPCVSMFINVDDGSPMEGLESHTDKMDVYAFNILGSTTWVSETPERTDIKEYDVEPGDLFVMPAFVRHRVYLRERPRISFGIHNPGYE